MNLIKTMQKNICLRRFAQLISACFLFVFIVNTAISKEFVFNSSDGRIEVFGEYSKPTADFKAKCSSVVNKSLWYGSEDGFAITSLQIYSVDKNTTYVIPIKHTCGYYDVPDGPAKNPFSISLRYTKDGSEVILDDLLDGNEYTYRLLIYINLNSGYIESCIMPISIMAPVPYNGNIYNE